MTDDLGVFIAGCYDEAEALARKAGAGGRVLSGRWYKDEEGNVQDEAPGGGGNAYIACGPYGDGLNDHYADHIVAADPAHRLADLTLKRAILAEHQPVQITGEWVVCYRCTTWEAGTFYGDEDDGEDPVDMSRASWPCLTVRQLGTEFAAKPGYRTEWKP